MKKPLPTARNERGIVLVNHLKTIPSIKIPHWTSFFLGSVVLSGLIGCLGLYVSLQQEGFKEQTGKAFQPDPFQRSFPWGR